MRIVEIERRVEDTLRYLIHFSAAVLVAASVIVGGLVAGIVPHVSKTASAAPAVPVGDGSPEYFPDRFRDVKVWDERPQPEAF